ncbi:MAG TPA: hypothetical protein VK459_12775 [Polyangiaceae bacterium]|jgi:hypothetical protein|nr:hypothetical protein [Polyangiaceae bacterium]
MRPLGFAAALALALGAVACNGDPGSGVGAPALPPPPLDTIEDTWRWEGAWSSRSCGAREFERLIKLQEGGELRGEDRVAPCPAGSQCMWSGIIFWSGSWMIDGDLVIVTEVNPPPGPVDAPRPTVLEWSEYTESPAERSAEGRLCAYEEVQLQVPPAPIQPESVLDE